MGAAPLSTLSPGDSVIESSFGERLALTGDSMSRWMGWRLRLLVIAALIGCLGLFLLAREMAALPRIDAGWRATAQPACANTARSVSAPAKAPDERGRVSRFIAYPHALLS